MSTTQPSAWPASLMPTPWEAVVPATALLAYLTNVVGPEIALPVGAIGVTGALGMRALAWPTATPVGETTVKCNKPPPPVPTHTREQKAAALDEATQAWQKLMATHYAILGKGRAAGKLDEKLEMFKSLTAKKDRVDGLIPRIEKITREFNFGDWDRVDDHLGRLPGTTAHEIASVRATVAGFHDDVPRLEEEFKEFVREVGNIEQNVQSEMRKWSVDDLVEEHRTVTKKNTDLPRAEAKILGPAYRWEAMLYDEDWVQSTHNALSEIQTAVVAVNARREQEKAAAVEAKRSRRGAAPEAPAAAAPVRRYEIVKPPQIVMTLNGAPADRAALVMHARQILDDASDSSIQRCVTVLENGDRGKSCKDVNGNEHGGIRHTSAGKKGAAGTCTLFYHHAQAGDKVTCNLVAVGQHAPAHVGKVAYNVMDTAEPANLGTGHLILER